MTEKRIVNSLLDVDRYKFTMSQFAFFKYRRVLVGYEFTNRTKSPLINAILVTLIPFIKKEILHVQGLRFKFSELTYLKTQLIFKDEYLDFLSQISLDGVKVQQKNGILSIEVEEGEWATKMFWETILLCIVSELYGRWCAYHKYLETDEKFAQLYTVEDCLNGNIDALNIINKQYYNEAFHLLDEKIKTLKHHPEIKFFDFSTRRRFSRELQEEIIIKLKDAFNKPQFYGGSQFIGTSNEYLAMKHGLKAGGTLAHETFSVIAGLNSDSKEKLVNSQYEFLREWNEFYGYDLSVALTDTFGSDYFFEHCPEDIAKMYSFREDSATDLYDYTEKVMKLYRSYNIDINDKVVVHSNGLDIPKSIEIDSFSRGKINKIYGIGSNIGADVGNGFKNLSIVIKAVKANGYHLVKLSDNLAKAIGDKETVEKYKQAFDYNVKDSVQQYY